MVTASNQQNLLSSNPVPAAASGRNLYRIVSFACLAGFTLDMLSIAMPPNLGALEWRVGFFQQLGDRGIILLLGAVFLMLGTLDMRQLRKQLALVSMGLGIAFLLFSVLTIRDGVVLQKQTATNITAQSSQVQEQLEKAKANPPANLKVTPDQINQALQQVNTRAEAVQKNASTQILKTSVRSVGNLAIIGLAMIGVGRYGLRSR